MPWQSIGTAPKDRRILIWTGQIIYAAHWAQNPYTNEIAYVVGSLGDEGRQLILKDAIYWADFPEPPKD